MTQPNAPKFVIEAEPTVQWPVKARIPANGGLVDVEFTATMRVFSEAEYADMGTGDPARVAGKPLREVLEHNARELPRHVIDWQGVERPDGTPVPVSELPDQITGRYGLALSRALWNAVGEIRYGVDAQPAATAGNSAPSPVAGSSSAATAATTN